MSMPKISKSGVGKCDAVNDIIESVALMETALSHILNAEGEKIQKAVGTLNSGYGKPQPGLACSTEELVCIDESVENVIRAITILESLLQKKLNDALKEKCPPKKKHHCFSNPCEHDDDDFYTPEPCEHEESCCCKK